MTASPNIDVRDLRSVRKAARESDVVLGDDYLTPDSVMDREYREQHGKKRLFTVKSSPLARKIITFNLLSIIILVAGVLFLNPSRENLAFQRTQGLVREAELIADVFEATLPAGAPVNLATSDGIEADLVLGGLDIRGGVKVFIFDPTGVLIAEREAEANTTFTNGSTVLTDLLYRGWNALSQIFGPSTSKRVILSDIDRARTTAVEAVGSGNEAQISLGADGGTVFSVATPILQNNAAIGAVAVLSADGELDQLVRQEREQVLQMLIIGVVVSIAMSLVLASTIANPLADLAAAAELGRDRNARKMNPGRIRIPDLTARPDEIGRLSAALRGMVAALYERIENNEQFAADVAHEIKNPLASLRSAVGTLRVAKRDDQRERLLEVIEHDVVRLDRLVSDISNASRLDSELVKEEEEEFDLIKMVGNLNEFLGGQAREKGIDYLTDMPNVPIRISGLEGRLAQVFVNLITNAISFCEEGDAIRVWVRRRDNRVLVVVEDTGPGIPDTALTKIFKRFYSERPAGQFGNNSGLGLAISKQIVEAHGGVIWAENIRPTEADISSEPLGARFVVGLPV
ncbi:sensor histidine kinase [Marivivens sp. LCG002]|uniref:sensor histidine kinase n=1 Tax=Marivivens sp. LCG002 TaxID=3051171 RepID=UPI0025569588|nr:sensor histidine kinase [Marivivens sp. LCG002]WIV51051.1 sensor histidine kinase [Marivivens sp. LCG002]